MPEEFLSNFGMIIPKGPFMEPPRKTYPKRWACQLIGHRWQNVMVTTFNRTLPEECARCGKKRWLNYNHWRKKLSRFYSGFMKTVDVVLRPLCKFGWHRWKGTYRTSSFSYGPGGGQRHPDEQHYTCARCNSHKTVNIK